MSRVSRLNGRIGTKDVAAQYAPVGAYNLATAPRLQKTAPVKTMWLNPAVSAVTVLSGLSSSTSDTTTYALGRSCSSASTNGTSPRQAIFGRTGMTIDATGQFVRLWIKVDDFAKASTIEVLLGDDAMANYYTCQAWTSVGIVEAQSNLRSGEWTVLDLPWANFVATGSPNRSALTAIKVVCTDVAGAGGTRFYLGGVAGVATSSKLPSGCVILTFDDCFSSQDDVCRPYMDRYGYAGTLYPVFEAFDTAGSLTTARALAMARVNGWDLGLHASTWAAHAAGFDTFTADQMRAEIETQLAWLKAHGVAGDSFAWPLTYSSTLVEQVVAGYCRTARGGITRTAETIPPNQPYRLRVIQCNAAASLATLKGGVDAAKNHQVAAIYTIHGVVASGASGNAITTATFQGLIDYIAAQGVPVLTMAQFANQL